MNATLVWAFKPLQELNRQTGFVVCDRTLAAVLIDRQQVQDPRVGALFLKDIQPEPDDGEPEPAQTYATRMLTATPGKQHKSRGARR